MRARPAPDPAQRDRIADVFARALDLAPSERARYLDAACAGSADLRTEVESLLAAHDAAGDFLVTGAEAAAAPEAALEDGPHGRRVGPYRLLRELGRGGMGVVYLAERAEGGFEQRVAVKLIKRGMDTDAILGRFLRERQILAALDHANVARLLDGGVTDDGQPFFALEYVDGVPLTTYCDEQRLGVDDRLRLFEDGCRAVQHAHAKLVVHRDLKPSNMLVTREGRLKLLDFGVAKLLAEDEPHVTRTGERLLTPQYAAPEQVRGEPVTTATDVYALGVVLYELLTGRPPHHALDAAALARAVCDTVPPPPSAAVRGEAAAAAARRLSPPRLARRLSGDLDTLVLKALRKEPERRYASAEALAEDVRRHRVGLPVTARSDTVRYRAVKFVRRHRAGVAAAVVAALALVGGLAASVWQARIAARERDAARAGEAKARAVQDFLVSLFEGADPAEAKGQEITARELLDRGAARIESQLSSQPAVQGELLHTIGSISQSLGRYDQAQALQQRALDLVRRTQGPEHPQVARALQAIASLRLEQGDQRGAEDFSRQALAMRRRLHPQGAVELAASLEFLGNVMMTRARLAEAETLIREALAMRRQILGPDHPDTAVTLTDLGNLLQAKGDYPGAVAQHREAIRVREAALGPLHPEIANSLIDLGAALLSAGDAVGAERAHRDALAANRRVFGEEHPAVLRSLEHLGATLHSKGDLRGAEATYRHALALRRKLLGNEHTDVAITLTNLASALAEQARFDEAMPLFAEALALQERATGEGVRVAHTLRRQAAALLDQGRPRQALPVAERAIAMYRERYDPRHPLVARCTALLAAIRAALGQPELAESLYREALDAQRHSLPGAHFLTVGTLVELGELLTARGRPAEAEPLLREALRQAEQSLPEGHWRLGVVQSVLGACLARRGRDQEARRLLESGYERVSRVLGHEHPEARRAHRRLRGA
ncbi:MAG TPA: serine/threonine-protein kinase [Vicinamibacteria bacterium]